MITIESNIKFLSLFNAWRRDISDTHPMHNQKEIGLNIDFAITQLKIMQPEQGKDLTSFFCKSCWKIKPAIGSVNKNDSIGRKQKVCATCIKIINENKK